jgi:integrase
MKANDALNKMMDWMMAVGKTAKTAENTWREVAHFLENMELVDTHTRKIDEIIVNNYINNGKKLTSVNTRRYKLSALKAFFNYNVAKGWMPGNPASLVKVDIRKVPHRLREAKKKEAFTPAEVKYIIANTEGFWRAAILIAVETGLRIGDIVQLEWDCFSLTHIEVWTDKRDKKVKLKMSAKLRKAIMGIPKEDEEFVFPEERMRYLPPSEGGWGTRTWFATTFKRMMERFGIDDKTFHCLRVTHASSRKAKGEDIEQIAKDLAHSSSATTTKHYIS